MTGMAPVARLGYGARAVVYVIVGGLTTLAAINGGGGTTDTRGALQAVLAQPFGKILLAAIAVGLVAHAVWRIVQGIGDVDRHGAGAKGLIVRGALLIAAVTYGLLAFYALDLLFNFDDGGFGGGNSERSWVARLLQQPFGPWLVIIIGLIVMAAGLAHFQKAWTARFERRLDLHPETRRWARPVCRFGLAARGVVFLIIGGFLVIAGFEVDAGAVRDLRGVLDAVRAQPYGGPLLAILALGLVAFGAYSAIEARFRRI